MAESLLLIHKQEAEREEDKEMGGAVRGERQTETESDRDRDRQIEIETDRQID